MSFQSQQVIRLKNWDFIADQIIDDCNIFYKWAPQVIVPNYSSVRVTYFVSDATSTVTGQRRTFGNKQRGSPFQMYAGTLATDKSLSHWSRCAVTCKWICKLHISKSHIHSAESNISRAKWGTPPCVQDEIFHLVKNCRDLRCFIYGGKIRLYLCNLCDLCNILCTLIF